MSRTMALAELLPDVDVPRGLMVSGLVQDSRSVQPGDAFVAIAGFGAHGLGFVEQARASGASAILFEPPAPADLPAPTDAIAVPRTFEHRDVDPRWPAVRSRPGPRI